MQRIHPINVHIKLALLLAIALAITVPTGARPLEDAADRSSMFSVPLEIPLAKICPFGLWPYNEVPSGTFTVSLQHNIQSNNVITSLMSVNKISGVLKGSVTGTKWEAKAFTEVHNTPMLTKQADGSLSGADTLYIKVIGEAPSVAQSANIEIFRRPSRPEPPVFIVKLPIGLKVQSGGVVRVDKLSKPEVTCI